MYLTYDVIGPLIAQLNGNRPTYSPMPFQSVKLFEELSRNPQIACIYESQLTWVHPHFPVASSRKQMSKRWRAVAGLLKSAAGTPVRRSYHTIQAVPREISGPRISARDRAQGRIPTVVFSQSFAQTNPNDPTSVAASSTVSRKLLLTTERKQIKAILKNIELPFFCSTTFPLQIRAGAGSSTILENGKVLPIKVSGSLLYW